MDEAADAGSYGTRVLERFDQPLRAGVPRGANRVGSATSKPRSSRVRLHLRAEEGLIQAAGFEVLGCPHTLAAADLVCEDLEGRNEAELADYQASFLEDALPLPADKLDIRILLEDAVRAATHTEFRATTARGD